MRKIPVIDRLQGTLRRAGLHKRHHHGGLVMKIGMRLPDLRDLRGAFW